MTDRTHDRLYDPDRPKPFLLYIAGPMNGLPELNHPAFREAEKRLRAKGFATESPVDNDGIATRGLTKNGRYRALLRLGIMQMTLCDGIALLPGWEQSNGARLEREVAKQCGLVVYTLGTWLSDDAGVLADGTAYVRRSMYPAGFMRGDGNRGEDATTEIPLSPMVRPYVLPQQGLSDEGYEGREQAGL